MSIQLFANKPYCNTSLRNQKYCSIAYSSNSISNFMSGVSNLSDVWSNVGVSLAFLIDGDWSINRLNSLGNWDKL